MIEKKELEILKQADAIRELTNEYYHNKIINFVQWSNTIDVLNTIEFNIKHKEA